MKLTFLGAGWFVGVCLARFELDHPLVVGTILLLLGSFVAWRAGIAIALGSLALLASGFALSTSNERTTLPEGEFVRRFEVEVTEAPTPRGPRDGYLVEVREIAEKEWEGRRLLLEVPAFIELAYGDVVRLAATLEPLDVDQPFDRHLTAEGIAGKARYPESVVIVASGKGDWWREVLLDIRESTSSAIDDALPEPASGLARGMLLGERSAIDPALRRQLSDAGTAHYIVISGQNMVLLAAAIVTLAGAFLSRRSAALLALAAIAAYTLFLGAPPSILRAALMSCLFVLAPVLGRQSHGVASLSLAGVAITAVDPAAVSDLSFQLSFAATAGLLVLGPPIDALLGDLARKAPVALPVVAVEVVALSVAASLATMPITAINFDQVTLAQVLSNPPLFLLFAPMLLFALMAIPAGIVGGDIGVVLAWPAWALFETFRLVSEFAAELPLLFEVDGFTSLHAALWYGVLLLLVFLASGKAISEREPTAMLRPSPAMLAVVMLAANGLVWSSIIGENEGELRISFLSVGQGDAVIIETPEGQRILIDGGPDPERLVRELDRVLGYGSRRIDLLVLTHVASDHTTGAIAALEHYSVDRVAWTGVDSSGVLGTAWLEAIRLSAAEQMLLATGVQLDLGNNVLIEVLSPDPDGQQLEGNDASLVIRLRYQEVAILFTGDLEAPGEANILRAGGSLEAQLLKVGHQGSDTSTIPELVSAVAPRYAVIPVGAANAYGHPSPAVIDRLERAGVIVFRTDRDGTVTFSSDGEDIWLD